MTYLDIPDFARDVLLKLFDTSESGMYPLNPKFLKWASLARYKYPNPDRIARELDFARQSLRFYNLRSDVVINAAASIREWTVSMDVTFSADRIIPLMEDYLVAIHCRHYIDHKGIVQKTEELQETKYLFFIKSVSLSICFIESMDYKL